MMHGQQNVKLFKVVITEIYSWISWELVADHLGSTEHILGTTG